MIFQGILKKTFSAKHTFLTHKNKKINQKFLHKFLVQSFYIEYMHIDMYFIKHRRRRMSDRISSMGLKSRRAKNSTNIPMNDNQLSNKYHNENKLSSYSVLRKVLKKLWN